MNKEQLRQLLKGVSDGYVSVDDAVKEINLAPFEDLGFARVDHHRALRQGAAEVIYGAGKTTAQIRGILASMTQNGAKNIIITRIAPEAAEEISREFPLDYTPEARIAVACPDRDLKLVGSVVVACGGTSDIPVCEEAAVTAQALGSRVHRLYDVGVSGLHRLLSGLDLLSEARAVVAVAGMEGALASVIGGLVDCPVIAVPTGVGYGASFGGVAALLAMLNSCASGVSVVNIDNGFGAGYIASMINKAGGPK
ncbi:MAG: nickel pincer cofactor biosynthesis protein LarB [Oscillospiraceae bacterium]|nr:nickel pincer cofactor biosynthesis protein LarB [Oscillospiraceae bacterium]